MVTIGQSIAHYEILEKLGEGGMGVVYKARDKHLDRIVALKLLHSEKLAGEDWRRRFAAEARAASGLNHPNIITIYELFLKDEEYFIAMEWVQGKTLDQLIQRKGMRLNTALKIAIQITEALAAAAAVGVVHRDIKPSNIMVTESGLVKVLDFGLAKITLAAETDQNPPNFEETLPLPGSAGVRTMTGMVLGTGPYMSPEQAEGKPVDARSDIFSFGSLLYEMATGQRAFRGTSIISTVTSILRDEPTRPSQLAHDIPHDLEKAILRCLRKDPERRFQNIADVRLALLELKEESESGQWVRPANKSWHGRRLWISAAALIAVAAFAAIWFFPRPPRPELHTEAVPFSNYAGFQGYPSFSPDGRQVAFAWTGSTGTTTHIFIKVIGTDSDLQLTSAPFSDHHPAWAPDGRSIAFLRGVSPTRTGVYEVPPLGGSARELSEFGTGLFPTLSWSSNGNWLVTSGYPAGQNQPMRLLAVSRPSGELRVIAPHSPSDEFSPALSPDSHLLAFSKLVAEWDWQLRVVPVNDDLQPTGKMQDIRAPSGTNRQTVWTADGNDLIYANGGSVNTKLWRSSISGNNPPRPVLPGDGVGYQPAIAPLGKRLAYVHDFNNSSIWGSTVAAGGKAASPVQTIFSARSGWIQPGAFSQDGRKFAFESTRSGQRAIWISNADGSNPELAFGEPEYSSGSPVWSPDSRWIAFDGRRHGKGNIYAVPTAGGAVRQLTNADDDDLVPCWSHNGQWVYYGSIREGRPEVYKVAASGGKEIPVTVNGGWGPQESPDGKYLYYTRARTTDTQLWRMPVEGGPEEMVMASVRERRWAVTNEGVWYMKSADPGEKDRWMMESAGSPDGTVEFLRLANHSVISAGLIVKDPVSGLAVSPDGSMLLFGRLDHRASEIVLLENFQ